VAISRRLKAVMDRMRTLPPQPPTPPPTPTSGTKQARQSKSDVRRGELGKEAAALADSLARDLGGESFDLDITVKRKP